MNLDEKLAAYEARKAERIAEENRQEELRQSYLKRTGRTSLTPERPAARANHR